MLREDELLPKRTANLLLSMLRCRCAATRWRASLNSRCKPSRSSDGFFSTKLVISISILLPSTADRYKNRIAMKLYLQYGEFYVMVLTWLDALNSSMVWHLSRAWTSLTITGGLIKLVSTFNTLRVLLFSIASASRRAVLSVRPTFVSERTSRCSFWGSAAMSCSSFSSEMFYNK